MKRLILYVMMMGIAIAINSCEKETFEPGNLAGTITFKAGLRELYFTVSLDKTRYMVGETAKATVSVSENYCKVNNSWYNGTVTIAGKEYYVFREEVLKSACGSLPWVLDDIPVETTPGNYSATFAITKFIYLSFEVFTITNTEKVQIPYEVR